MLFKERFVARWFSTIRLLMRSLVSSLIDQGPNKDLSLSCALSLFNEVRFVLKISLCEVLFLRSVFP